jgi:hypothetical protein
MGMAELDRSVDFDYNSVEMTDRLIQCAQHALPYFSTQVPYSYSQALFRIRDILIRIRILGSVHLITDPALFGSVLQDANKK